MDRNGRQGRKMENIKYGADGGEDDLPDLITGYSSQPENHWWNGYQHNWNLILVSRGEARLQLSGNRCTMLPHSLHLISPGGIRNFITETQWECYWVHFDSSLYIDNLAKWEEVIPGVRSLPLEQRDYRVIQHVFVQNIQLASRRENGWRRLCYCLIQEIILRGNIIAGRAFDSDGTVLAHKLLSNLQNNLSMDKIAARCGMSRSVFFARFGDTFGVSPRRYREQVLMRTVQTLLETTDLSLKDIAARVHIENTFYLSSSFKRCCGCSPTEYRKKCRQSESRTKS